MRQTPIRRIGKVGKATAKTMREETPYLCERAEGTWYGWHAPICCGDARCEYCGKRAEELARAHIIGRGRQGADDRTNLAILCPKCHTDLDNERVPGMREKLLAIVKERNERMEGR